MSIMISQVSDGLCALSSDASRACFLFVKGLKNPGRRLVRFLKARWFGQVLKERRRTEEAQRLNTERTEHLGSSHGGTHNPAT